MNLKIVHYIMLVLAAVAIAAPALATSLPAYAAALNTAGGVAAGVLGALALVSPSAAVGVPPVPQPAAAPNLAGVHASGGTTTTGVSS